MRIQPIAVGNSVHRNLGKSLEAFSKISRMKLDERGLNPQYFVSMATELSV